MNAILRKPWIFELLRLGLGVVFVWAGTVKFQAPQAFADSIASFRLLPVELINPLALGLPPFEVATGSMCILGFRRRLGTFSALVLCTIFSAALISALVRGLEVDCGCFGPGGSSVAKMWLSLGRALTLAALAAVLYRFELRMAKGHGAVLGAVRRVSEQVPEV
jgi:uncharacterized membrane protein YphA (DoxX/SURF4 family)